MKWYVYISEIFFFETKTEVKWKQRCNKLTCTLHKLNIEKKNSVRYTFHSSLFTGCYMMVLYQTKNRHWWRFPVLSGGIYRTPDCEPWWVLLWECHIPYPLKSIFVSFENFRAFPNSPYSSSCSQKSFPLFTYVRCWFLFNIYLLGNLFSSWRCTKCLCLGRYTTISMLNYIYHNKYNWNIINKMYLYQDDN